MYNFIGKTINKTHGDEFYNILEGEKLYGYGKTMLVSRVREILGINLPDQGATRKEYENATLIELGYVAYVRDKLLEKGMYLEKAGTNYRVLLASENALKVKRYLQSAKRRVKKAQTLQQAAQPASYQPVDNTAVRLQAQVITIEKAEVIADLMS